MIFRIANLTLSSIRINKQKQYRALGIMSGTSLDGLDLCLVHFEQDGAQWKHRFEKGISLPYDANWSRQLAEAHLLDGVSLSQLDRAYGKYIGEKAADFLAGEKVDFVASHGHTVFHQPAQGVSLQIGHGAAIAAACLQTTISDFRSLDVALGGQGAPLVPIGDRLLYGKYAACINIGGIANISFERDNQRIAFDIAPANQLLNHLAKQMGNPYDEDGLNARSGTVNHALISALNGHHYYQKQAPKSLGREDVEAWFLPLIDQNESPTTDLLATVTEHLAIQIGNAIQSINQDAKVLISGGGAYNSFLIERIRHHSILTIEIPSAEEIEFKEAIIFAFLGLLRLLELPNCLKSVTGASRDNCGGSIFLMSN